MRKYIKKMHQYLMSFHIPILLAIPFSPIVVVFEKYVFGDWEFVKYLVTAMIIDTLLGFIHHLLQKDFSIEGFEKIFVKVICYGSALAVAHILSSFTVLGDPIEGFIWFRTTIYTALLIRECLSILNNVDKLKPDIVPSRIKRYLKYYDETGEIRKDNFVEK